MAPCTKLSCAKYIILTIVISINWISVSIANKNSAQYGHKRYPFWNTSLSWDERLDDLIGRLLLDDMTLMMARGGAGPNSSPAIGRSPDKLGIGPYNWNTECLRGDSEAGNATSFPQALGLAAAFSRDLIHDVARATGLEVRAKHNNWTKHGVTGDHKGLSCFSPVINIMRHPLWGRNQETYGEDPYMTGEFARSFIHGLQGDHPRFVLANAGCKHFDVHGGPENIPSSRFTFDAKVSDHDWHTTFLPQFHECVKAGTYSFMCSYNSINGIPACANRKLLTDILRTEWGFTGYVVSDEMAVENIYKRHNYTAGPLETVVASVKAGCNLELCLSTDNVFMHIPEAVQLGMLSMGEVMQGVRPLFYTRMRLGEFDPPDDNPYTKLEVLKVVESAEHRALAVKVAVKSFVLLKNKGNVLPVDRIKTLGIVGPFMNSSKEIFGSYAPMTERQFTETPLEGLSKIAEKTQGASGCNNPKCSQYDKAQVAMALKVADFVVVCLGTGTSVETEGTDRSSLNLPGNQEILLQDAVQLGFELEEYLDSLVYPENPTHAQLGLKSGLRPGQAGGKPLVLLLFNAGPLDIGWAMNSSGVHAIVECFFPAQATGEALKQMFTNAPGANPAGRLPATWPVSMQQVPPMEDYSMTGRTYRYFIGDPLFPFGYGLSYTNFTYSSLVIKPATVKPCDNVTVSVTVHNIGNLTGDEVTQVYIHWPDGISPPPPQLQLVNFNRTEIPVGSQTTLNFTISPRVRAVYSDKWIIVPGTYQVYVGGQQPQQKSHTSSNVLKSNFTITNGDVTPLSKCVYPG